MRKAELDAAVEAYKSETKQAIEQLLANLNKGQRKKLVNNAEVKKLLKTYGVEVDT